jgi:hypothetical protein
LATRTYMPAALADYRDFAGVLGLVCGGALRLTGPIALTVMVFI